MKPTLQTLLVLLLLAFAPPSPAQNAEEQKPVRVPLTDALVDRLPPDYRPEAKALITVPDTYQHRLAAMPDDKLTAAIISQLGYTPAAAPFLVAQLEKEPSGPLRARLIDSLAQYWPSHPESAYLLEHHAAADPDANAALKALAQLRTLRMADLGKLLQTRLQLAQDAHDPTGLSALALEQERRYSWYEELSLPAFLRTPPPPFSVKAPNKPIRVLAFGDFGFGNDAQKETAAAMVRYNAQHRFDFGLTVGDNFYTYGMASPSDPRWQSQFEQLYGPMKIKIYASFGNHDYGQPDSPAAEILYSRDSPDWRLPSPYYTYTAGPVQFFAIDTIDLSEAELVWLGEQLAKSQAPWKLVYGHYPIYSATGEMKDLIDRLLPVLKQGGADIYLCGHHHNLQELKPDGKLHFFVSGGGGATLYDLKPNYDRSLFTEKINGFTVLEADAHEVTVRFIARDGRELYTDTIRK